MKSSIFKYRIPFSLSKINQLFEWTCHFHLQGRINYARYKHEAIARTPLFSRDYTALCARRWTPLIMGTFKAYQEAPRKPTEKVSMGNLSPDRASKSGRSEYEASVQAKVALVVYDIMCAANLKQAS
jgi:hypothetical protein